MLRTDNPLADFDRYDRTQAEWLRSRPVCAYCGEPIQDEYCYKIGGDVICRKCLDDEFKCDTEAMVS